MSKTSNTTTSNTNVINGGIDASLNIGDKAEKIMIPLHCDGGQKNSYGNTVWHVHLDDMQMNHYYLMTTSESIVKEIMAHVDHCIKMKFIVAGIRQFENCVRIKNVAIVK